MSAASPHTSRLAKLILITFGLAIALVGLEIGLRIWEKIDNRRARQEAGATATPQGEFWGIPDPDLGYRLNPKWGDVNEQGLRDHPVGAKNGRFRLLFLGDSIAQCGDTVDDTFVGHLRAQLRQQRPSPPLDVVNAGIRGYTNYQELMFLKKFGLGFEPDLVGVEFCLNDLNRFMHTIRVENGRASYVWSDEAKRVGREAAARRPSPRRTLLERAMNRSRLVSWLGQRLPTAMRTVAWRASDGYSFDYRTDVSSAWRDDGWATVESQLVEMRDLGQRYRFRVFLVVVPIATQYDAAYLKGDREYVLKPQRRIREICERLGIPFYDLYPDLDASMFLPDAIHLTKPGRERVGRRVADFLMASDLLPH
jgi:lysophospholipase L1-like esterase